MWQVNSHNPRSGHCPLTPECVYCTPLPGPPKGKVVMQHMSLRSPLHWAFWCCSLPKLLLCWLWRRIVNYHDCVDSTDEQHHPQHDVTEAVVLVFLALTLQMGHTIQGRLEDYRTKSEQLCCPFCRQTMAHSSFCRILRFLHFTDNNRMVDSRDRLWKIRDLFEILRTNFAKFYSPSEHLVVDEVIVKLKGRVIFKQYIPKKRKRFGIKVYKLCDSSSYTYDMDVYLGKDRQRVAQHLTTTHATVTNLTRRVEGVGHKLYMDKFFSPPNLYDDLIQKKIYCCGTVRLNRQGMPKDLKHKTLRLKWGIFG